MHIKKIDNPCFSLILHLSSKNDLISFNTCIEINANSVLPSNLLFFKQKDSKLFSTIKLKSFNCELLKLEFIFKKEVSYKKMCSFLKKHLPTVFDRKIIMKMNNEFDLNDYYDYLISGIKNIFSEDEFRRYKDELDGKVGREVSLSDECSIIESMTDICSDELINI